MGIQGLLPLLKSIMVPCHIRDLRGCRVAVDTYSWLHKGALSCSRELCKSTPTSRHIDYCMHRVNLLRHYGVEPILVFDGGLLPMKIEQENKRARVRKENLARAIEHESNGNSAAAYECYQKAVDISPSIACELIQVLKQENVSYIVAPYEADAQMTFLAVSQQVDAVITEDSDLIPFGCPRIIFKMDKFGQGVEFKYSIIQQNKELSFAGFTKQMILEMCILSGCDYLQSLPGMGLKKAHALIKKFKSYDRVIKHLRYATGSVPPLYEESFKKAMLTFQHQRVYDPTIEDIVHLSVLSDNVGDDLDFLGPSISQDIAKGIATGYLDPFTKMPFQRENASDGLLLDGTYQLKSFKPESERKTIELPAQKNLLTNYFCFASLEAKRKFRAPRITPVGCNSVHRGTTCLSTSVFSSGNLGNATPSNDSVEEIGAAKAPEFIESASHGDRRSQEHSLLQQSRHSLHKTCLALHKEDECKYDLDAGESKMPVENRKSIVRSRYFQHKSVKENDRDNEMERLLVNNDDETDIFENNNPQSPPFVKRKSTSLDSIQPDVKAKCMRTNASLVNQSNCDPDVGDTFLETKEEGKFGSNISHLGHYSDIAEKSMERFVSVLSSFKYSSSGSRASGLRAPLRDVQNIRPTRSIDIHKFAYVPNKTRTVSASQKRLNINSI